MILDNLKLTPAQRYARLLACAAAENKLLKGANTYQNANRKGGRPRMTSELKDSEPARQMFYHYQDGRTLAQTAEILNISMNLARRRARRYRLSFADYKNG